MHWLTGQGGNDAQKNGDHVETGADSVHSQFNVQVHITAVSNDTCLSPSTEQYNFIFSIAFIEIINLYANACNHISVKQLPQSTKELLVLIFRDQYVIVYELCYYVCYYCVSVLFRTQYTSIHNDSDKPINHTFIAFFYFVSVLAL